MDTAETDVLAFMNFPKDYRPKIHSTNPLERPSGGSCGTLFTDFRAWLPTPRSDEARAAAFWEVVNKQHLLINKFFLLLAKPCPL
jgi:transposase-like protein